MITAMTYNLRHGGGGRLPAIVDVIAARRPDVLAVQELGRPEQGALRRLVDALRARGRDMRGFAGRALPAGLFGQPVGVLVHRRLRILDAGPVPGPLHHGAVAVTVDTDQGALTVCSAHLYPYRGGPRLWEARRLRDLADPARRLLLLGDLNALSPDDDEAATAAAVAAMPARHRVRHLRRGRGGARVDTRAVAALTSAGLIDLVGRAGRAAPTVPTRHAGHEFSPAGLRVDYALGTPPVAAALRDAGVVTDAPADIASDHYPLVLTLAARPVP